MTFEPCIPTAADKPPSGPGWVHEIKHDGFRLVARRDDTGVCLTTRNGHDWTDRYPTVAAAVDRLACQSCVIDGETLTKSLGVNCTQCLSQRVFFGAMKVGAPLRHRRAFMNYRVAV